MPMMVIKLDMASDRLFTASRTTAMEPARIPAIALNAARNMFAPMPIRLVRTIMASLDIGSLFAVINCLLQKQMQDAVQIRRVLFGKMDA